MSILADLEKLSAAEDFFSFLKVDYDPARLRVARLHILKRMGAYLAAKDFAGLNEERIFEEVREALVQAYSDFIESKPLDERLFKVLQDRDPARAKPSASGAPKAFVPLDQLTVTGR